MDLEGIDARLMIATDEHARAQSEFYGPTSSEVADHWQREIRHSIGQYAYMIASGEPDTTPSLVLMNRKQGNVMAFIHGVDNEGQRCFYSRSSRYQIDVVKVSADGLVEDIASEYYGSSFDPHMGQQTLRLLHNAIWDATLNPSVAEKARIADSSL